MGNNLSSVLVNGQRMNFKGNFGFKINNQEYATRNGRVYNSQGQPLKELKMPKYIEEQFFAMSAMGDGAQDSTFSKYDIGFANELQHKTTNGTNSSADVQMRTLTGPNGKVQTGKTTVEDGVFSSQYKSKETGRVSTISIWTNE